MKHLSLVLKTICLKKQKVFKIKIYHCDDLQGILPVDVYVLL